MKSSAQIDNINDDYFNEEEAQARLLHAKPTCFVIFGKPGSGKTALAKRFAKAWNCQYIGGQECIANAIEYETELGKKAKELLLEGGSVPESMVIPILKERLQSPEVLHHGYILDDFPTVSEEYLSVADQLEFLKGLKYKPDFIVNIKIPDVDLINRRKGFKVDPLTNEIYVKDIYDKESDDKSKGMDNGDEEEEDVDEDEEEAGNNEDDKVEDDFGDDDLETPSPDIIERLTTRTEDFEENVKEGIHKYKGLLLRQLEDFMGDHDSQKLVELDGNLPPKLLFKELLARMNSALLHRAHVPLRLQGGEDQDDIPDDTDTDDMLRSLAASEMITPGFRWRRSRWGRLCPVSLYEGNIAQGAPQFAVSFLDKMYLMATAECMEKFIRCPRKYLQAPQPRPPCKLCILGPPLSGKTTLSKALADQYAAKVFDMKAMLQSHFKETKQNLLEEVKKEALENAIHRTLSLQQQEQENNAKKTIEEAEQEESQTPNEVNEEGETISAITEDVAGDVQADAAADAEGPTDSDKVVEAPVVDENHPEVKRLVEEALDAANNREITLGVDTYIDVLEAAILDWYKEMQEEEPNGRVAGNWILDNFPETREQFNAMTERGIVPDDIICLKDSSDENSLLIERWQELYKPDQIYSDETETGSEKNVASRVASIVEEASLGVETTITDNSSGGQDVIIEETLEEENESQPSVAETETGLVETVLPSSAQEEESTDPQDAQEAETRSSSSLKSSSMAGQDMEQYKKQLLEFERNWMSIQTSARNSNGIEPVLVDCGLPSDDIIEEVVDKISSIYQYKGWEYTGMDQDEEEEDLVEDEDLDEETRDEDDAFRGDNRKPFGDTRHFCPMQLKQNNVLWPGNPECAAKYKERVFFFSTPDARTKFLESPGDFLADKEPLKPPALRILLLGPKGSGKTIHGRTLAKKFGVFHISFKDLLQEKILSKTKKRIGPDYPEDDMEDENAPTDTEDLVTNAVQATDSQDTTSEDVDANNAEPASDEKGDTETGDAEAEKEVEVEWSEIEENIRDNILDNEPLNKTTLEEILPPFWRQEPFSSTGFILEGFPRTSEEVSYLADNGFFPDCAVFLGVEDMDIVKRLMPPLMDKWKKKRDIRIAKKEKELEIKKKKREADRKRRIEEKLAQIAEKKAEELREKELRRLEDGEDEDDEMEEDIEDEEDDVEAIVDAEMAEEYEEDVDPEEEEETEEDAIDRIRGELTDGFDDNMQALGFVRDSLEEAMIPRIDIEAGRKAHVVQYVIEKALKPAMENRKSLFDICQPISSALAKKMLLQGYKQTTKFGRWCPVKLSDGDILPSFETSRKPLYPVIYRHYIYFLSSEQARERFVSCPSVFTTQSSPLPSVPLRLAIIGPPKAGKTMLANRFVEEYGLVRLSIGEAMRKVLYTQDKTELSRQIQAHLRVGLTVPDELAIQALEVATLDVQCQTRGYVLDGYPLTENQVKLLTARSIIPFITFEVRVGDTTVLERGTLDRNSLYRVYPLHDSRSILSIKLANYHREIPFVRHWYQEQHRNLFTIDAERSKWWVWDDALKHTKDVGQKIRIYVDRSAKGFASRIADLCITPDEMKGRLGDVGQYCPVSLIDRGELVDCSEHESLEFAAEFRGHYYRLASQAEIIKFLETPEKYVPPLATRTLPEAHLLPLKRPPDTLSGQFPGQLELQGYCPVTYLDGDLRYEALVTGDPAFMVEYKEKVYACCSEEKRDRFMRLPEKYSSLILPRKIPPRKEPVPIASLSMIGFMEQSVAMAITKAMTAAGCFKPKYPFLTAGQSALLYVAYHLKAFNPKSSEYVRKKYKKKLDQFQERCKLIKYLGSIMTPKYCEPEDRPMDFDHKLLSFLSLKGTPPAAKWLT